MMGIHHHHGYTPTKYDGFCRYRHIYFEFHAIRDSKKELDVLCGYLIAIKASHSICNFCVIVDLFFFIRFYRQIDIHKYKGHFVSASQSIHFITFNIGFLSVFVLWFLFVFVYNNIMDNLDLIRLH